MRTSDTQNLMCVIYLSPFSPDNSLVELETGYGTCGTSFYMRIDNLSSKTNSTASSKDKFSP